MTLTANDIRFREALDELAKAARSRKPMPAERARELVRVAQDAYHETTFTFARWDYD